MARERKAGEAVFTGQARTKEVKMAANVVI